MLNKAQEETIKAEDSRILVVAGAGTGKTHLLIQKIKHLIEEKNILPEHILGITFTEKAANEIISRLEAELGYRSLNVELKTFHKFALDILGEYGEIIGLQKDFKVLENINELNFMQSNIFKLHLNKLLPLQNPYKFTQSLIDFFSRLNDDLITPEYFKELITRKAYSPKEVDDNYKEIFLEIYSAFKEYSTLKIQNGFVSIYDLIPYMYRLLKENPYILSKVNSHFKYILVDEFQDTNVAQYMVLKLLDPKQLILVGDDDQSIYRFRGADYKNILEVNNDFKNVKNIVLHENYRSNQDILDIGYALLQFNNPNRLEYTLKIDKKLIAKKNNNTKNGNIEYVEFNYYFEQYEYIAHRLNELKNTGKYSNFAILLRSSTRSVEIAKILKNNGIKFTNSFDSGLLEDEEIKLLLSFLKAVNDFTDDLSLFNTLKSRIYNINYIGLKNISINARRNNKTIYEYIKNSLEKDYQSIIGEREYTSIQNAIDNIDKYRAMDKENNAGEILNSFIHETKFLETIENVESIESVTKLFSKIDKYFKTNNNRSLEDIINYFNIAEESGKSDDQDIFDLSQMSDVNILSIHKAKGMEFDVVFLPDLTDKIFPLYQNSSNMFSFFDDNETMENLLEERRLMYVAITRAKEKLYIQSAKNYYSSVLRKPSRFLYEMGIINSSTNSNLEENIDDTSHKERNIDSKIDTNGKGITNYIAPHTVERNSNEEDNKQIIEINSSDIDDFIECKYRYFLSSTYGVTKKTYNLNFGSTIHELIAEYFSRFKNKSEQNGFSNEQSKEEYINQLLDKFEKNFSSFGFKSVEHENLYYNLGIKIINNLGKFDNIVNDIDNILIEYPLKTKVFDKFLIHTRFDLVNTKSNDIYEFKTTIVENEEEAMDRFDKSYQLRIFAYCYNKVYGINPTIHLYFPSNGVICSKQFSKTILNNTEKKLDEIYLQLLEKNFQPTSGEYSCRYCNLKDMCKYKFN